MTQLPSENKLSSDFPSKILEWLVNNENEKAKAACKFAITKGDYFPKLWFYYGVALERLGNYSEAATALTNAIKVSPQEIEIYNALATVYSAMGRHEDSLRIAELAYQLAPHSAQCLANLAVAWQRLGDFEKSILFNRNALNLDGLNYTAVINLAVDLIATQRMEEAFNHCIASINAGIKTLGLYNNLAEASIHLFDFEAALSACKKGLSLEPNSAALHLKSGLIYSCQQNFKLAQSAFSWAQVLNPNILKEYFPDRFKNDSLGNSVDVLDSVQIFINSTYYRLQRCDWRARDAYLETIRSEFLVKQHNPISSPMPSLGFPMLSMPFSSGERLDLMRKISEGVKKTAWLEGKKPFEFQRQLKPKLRIGYISPDMRMHPVGYLFALIPELHDHEQFEIYAYSLVCHDDNDPVRRKIMDSCDIFRDCGHLSDSQLAQFIYDDNIDILVDLAGYTMHAKFVTLALKPAPLIVSYFGYSGTMGADFIDYAFDNVFSTPLHLEKNWDEAVIRMPYSHFPFDTTTPIESGSGKREDYGLPPTGTVFCCFNTNYKVEPVIFECWMNILNNVPDSVLWLLSNLPDVEINLSLQAQKYGILPERLIFAPFMPHDEHLKRYHFADLFLDTYWHNAHTTALEVLWQGLPVLTCCGEVISSRWAASFLFTLDVPELITYDFDSYVNQAIMLANTSGALENLKNKVIEKRSSSPLFDIPRVVKEMEISFNYIWQRYVAKLNPISFSVESIKESIEPF